MLLISIHAPTRGATVDVMATYKDFIDFNPRSHKGSDLFTAFSAVTMSISIHAPTRGATISPLICIRFANHFNPRSHKGSDVNPEISGAIDKDFNPRSHKGSDDADLAIDGYAGISIHAPTRGATVSLRI